MTDPASANPRCPMCGESLLAEEGRCESCGELIRDAPDRIKRVGLFNWRLLVGLVALSTFAVLTFLQLQRIRDALDAQRTFHILICVALLCGVASGITLMAKGLILAMPATDDASDDLETMV